MKVQIANFMYILQIVTYLYILLIMFTINTKSCIKFENNTNTTVATCGEGSAYPSRAQEKTSGLLWGSCGSSIILVTQCVIVLIREFIGSIKFISGEAKPNPI